MADFKGIPELISFSEKNNAIDYALNDHLQRSKFITFDKE